MSRERAPLLPLSAFPLRAFDVIRFGDTDRLGHVNNAVFATYFETGRTAFISDPSRRLVPEGYSIVLARIAIDFRAEMMWPGRVEIGSRVAKIGRSSVIMDQALFVGDTCTATAESVVVLMDLATRRAAPFPESSLEILSGLAG